MSFFGITSCARQMTKDSLVLLLVLQIALQKALLHLELLTNRAGAHAVSTYLRARVALGLLGLEVDRIGAGTRGIYARAEHIIETLVTLHANRCCGRKCARVVTARSLTGTALLARLQLALVDLLAGVVAAGLFAVRAVAAVALLALLDYSIAAQ